jgi:hypothetical protein
MNSVMIEWTNMKDNPYVFFLGGQDLEMVTIRDLIRQVVPGRVFDKGLSWGACASAYREEIEQAMAHDQTPVLVELEDDLGLGPARIALVDHHGPRAGAEAPTSLHQVFELLGLPKARWSRWFELVAANDRGYIPALIQAGATREEIIEVRAADRRAQGITEEQEDAAAKALLHLERHAGGLLTVARLPHSRTAALSDRLQPELGGPDVDNLLVISPGEYNFFGAGNAVQALDRAFPGGWMGGALPVRGFWGHGVPMPGEAEVLAYLAEVLQMR